MKSIRILIYLLCLAVSGTAAAQSVERGGPSTQPNTTSNDAGFTSGWRLCNKSDYDKLWVAYSYYKGGNWVTKGWRPIENGKCEVLQSEITNRYAYYYASDFDGHDWTGNVDLCAERVKFDYTGTMPTCKEGYEIFPFYRWDFGENFTRNGKRTRDLVSTN